MGEGALWQPVLSKHTSGYKETLEILIFGPHGEGDELYPSLRIANTVYEGKIGFLCIQLSVTFFFVFVVLSTASVVA